MTSFSRSPLRHYFWILMPGCAGRGRNGCLIHRAFLRSQFFRSGLSAHAGRLASLFAGSLVMDFISLVYFRGLFSGSEGPSFAGFPRSRSLYDRFDAQG